MRYAFDALRRRPGRTILTSLGIGLATALVVVLLALSSGIESSSARLAAASGVDLLATSAKTQITSGTFPPVAQSHLLPTEVPQADPNVATASPWLVSDLVFANSSLYSASNRSSNGSGVPSGWGPTGAGSVGWIPSQNAGLETPALVAGPGFSASGDPHYSNGSYVGPVTHEFVADEGLATILHVEPGNLVWTSPQSPAGPSALASWFSNATAFRVVGISGPFWLIPSALLGFFYLSELQGMVGGANRSTDYSSLVLMHLNDPTRAAEDQTILQRAFPSLTVFTLTNVLGAVQNFVDLYRTFGEIIGLLAVAVATLFTTTVLLMSVDDRSRELALLRALGYPRATVGRYVVEEAILLSLFGLVIGLPAAFVGTWGLNAFLQRIVAGLPSGFSFVSFDFGVVLSGLIAVLVIALVAAIVPAVRAMQLPVAAELRAP